MKRPAWPKIQPGPESKAWSRLGLGLGFGLGLWLGLVWLGLEVL